jgi:2-hydroxy-3-oxopropionate reductase
MGAPMARHLLSAGHPLVVHTRTPERAKSLIVEGADWASSPRAVALAVEVVITMLPDSPDVREVVAGDEGILSAGRGAGLTWIDMSSINPGVTRELACLATAQWVTCLDAPVSGGEAGAISATLAVMVGGDRSTFDKWEQILRRLGSQVTYVGASGAGQTAKLCNQVVVGCAIAGAAEALALAGRLGVDPAVVREVMLGGLAQSKVLDLHGQRMIEERFESGFRAELHLKDMRNVMEAAATSGSPVFMSRQVAELLERQVAAGDGDRDHSGLYLLYRKGLGSEA